MGSVLFAWLAEVALITWRDFKTDRTLLSLPPASDYAATFVIFGGLMAVGDAGPGAQSFASISAWSLVLASALNLINPTFVKPTGTAQPTTTTSAPLAAGSTL